MDYIIKLVELYFFINLDKIPLYLLDNRKFMLERITLNFDKTHNKNNFKDIYNPLNKFRNDFDFIDICFQKIEVHFPYLESDVIKTFYNTILVKNENYLIKFLIKYPYFYFYVNEDIEHNYNILPKKIHDMYNDIDYKKYAIKKTKEMEMLDYIIFNNDVKLPKNKDFLFYLMKFKLIYIYLEDYPLLKDKIYKKFIIHGLSYYENNEYFNYVECLESIKKCIIYAIYMNPNYYFNNNKFVNYCVDRYGYFLNIYNIHKVMTIQMLKKSFYYLHDKSYKTEKYDKGLGNWIFLNYNAENMDKILLLSKNINTEGINLHKLVSYFFNYTNIYNQFICIKNYDILKLMSNCIRNDKYDNISDIINSSNELVFKYASYSKNFFEIYDNFLYNKKNIEKMCYYCKEIIKEIILSSKLYLFKIWKSKILDYSIKFDSYYIPKKIMNTNKILIKNIYKCRYRNVIFTRKQIQNNYFVIKNIKKYNIKFLCCYENLKNNKRIVYESLKNDENMICHTNVNYINDYIKYGFDINVLLSKIKKEITQK